MAAATSDGWPIAQQVNPQVELGGGAVKPGETTWLSGRGIGIVQGAKDSDAAWSFVRWVAATNDGTPPREGYDNRGETTAMARTGHGEGTEIGAVRCAPYPSAVATMVPFIPAMVCPNWAHTNW